jgi:divalent metal cation (Fe/Co/Zn/Cd) transporter
VALGLFIIYLLIKAVLLGIGIGIGFLLHWMLPVVDLGIGILIGVVATGIAVHFFTQLMASLNEFREQEIEQEIEKKTGRKVKLYSLDVITGRGRTKRKASL